MYLSQLVLDLRDRRTMRVLSDIYLLHEFVMSGFKKYVEPGRVLFRLEPETRGNGTRLLVQSPVKPTWDNIGYETGRVVMRSDTKEFIPQFPLGRHFRFRLRANPVVARDGKRYGLIRDEALVSWLKRKEGGIGVSLSSFVAIDEGYVTGMRKTAQGADRINIKTARYEGMLRVIDPIRFTSALSAGIGPSKGFGCGLLSLSRQI